MTLVYPDYKSLPIIDEDDKMWVEFMEFCYEGSYVKEGKRAELLQWILDKFPLVIVRHEKKTKYWEYFGVGRMGPWTDKNGNVFTNNFVWATLSDGACGECCLSSAIDDEDEIGCSLDDRYDVVIDVIKKP